MSKPYVICHMMSSVDGRTLIKKWSDQEKADEYAAIYEKTGSQLDGDAWLCGRVTMEKDFASDEPLLLQPVDKPIDRTDFIAPYEQRSFAVAIDPSGKLNWIAPDLDGDHLITILTEDVTDDYLAHLQECGISYLFGGKKEIDLNSVFERLTAIFGISRLLLEGGGHINGSVFNAGLIDEFSILLCPVADGSVNTATTLDVSESLPKVPTSQLKLVSVEEQDHEVLWLRYKIKR